MRGLGAVTDEVLMTSRDRSEAEINAEGDGLDALLDR